MYYLNVFLIYSILGNIFERIVTAIRHINYNSGFMGTFFTPLYGIGILLILFIHKNIRINNKIIKLIIEFIIFLLILTILEYLGGLLIENIFNKIFWNYSKMKYNLGYYISLETSTIWGIMSLIFIYVIHPIVDKLIKYIPKTLTIITGIFFLVNLIYIFIVKLT